MLSAWPSATTCCAREVVASIVGVDASAVADGKGVGLGSCGVAVAGSVVAAAPVGAAGLV